MKETLSLYSFEYYTKRNYFLSNVSFVTDFYENIFVNSQGLGISFTTLRFFFKYIYLMQADF